MTSTIIDPVPRRASGALYSLPALHPDVGAVAPRRRLDDADDRPAGQLVPRPRPCSERRAGGTCCSGTSTASRSTTTARCSADATGNVPTIQQRSDQLVRDRPAGDDHPDRHRRVRRVRVRVDRLQAAARRLFIAHRRRCSPIPLQVALIPLLLMYVQLRRPPDDPVVRQDDHGVPRPRPRRHDDRGVADATPRSACRSRSSCCTTTSRRCRRDLFEAARIDGADHFRIFWRLVLPLSVPVLAAFAIFQFLWTWNDYLVATCYRWSAAQLARRARRRSSSPPRLGQFGAVRAPARPPARSSRRRSRCRVLPAAALLRPRHPRRLGQGLTLARCATRSTPLPERATQRMRFVGLGRRRSGGSRSPR